MQALYEVKNKELQEQLNSLGTQKRELIDEEQQIWAKYHRILKEYRELTAIGEEEAAGKLYDELELMKNRVNIISDKLETMGGKEADGLFVLIAKFPDSKLHKMADEVVTLATQEVERLNPELSDAVAALQKAKADYIAQVTTIGRICKLTAAAYVVAKKTEKMLPKEKQGIERPTFPEWSIFEFTGTDISDAAGPRPFLLWV